jgi:hypothetical protein
MFARWSAITATAATTANTMTGHGWPSATEATGSDTAEANEATDA